MKIRNILLLASIFPFLLQAKPQDKQEIKNAATNGTQNEKQEQLSQLQQEISQVRQELSADKTKGAEQLASEIEQELKTISADVSKGIKKNIKQDIEETREELAALKKEIKRVDEQAQWYIEARVKESDPVTIVRDIETFNQILDNNELVVAYLYRLSNKEQQVIEKNGVRRRTKRWYTVDKHAASLASVAKTDLYRKARVQFIAVNLSYDQLDRLARRLKLQSDDTIMLFQDGVQYAEKTLTDAFDTHDIRQYVDKYFGDIAEDRAQQIEEKREEDDREVVRYVYDDYHRPRFNIGFGYGYPYYYDHYYYGYPYHRRYYGHPSFGFGFGW